MSNWNDDFKEFLETPAEKPAAPARASLFQTVRQDLNPSSFHVFLKILTLHLFAGSLTLLVCPQFGVGPLGGGHGLMHYFMQLGNAVCALFCGAFFFIGTALLSFLFLRPEDLKIARRHQLGQFTLLAVLSVAALMWGGSFRAQPLAFDWTFTLLWLASGIVVSQLLFLVGARVRSLY